MYKICAATLQSQVCCRCFNYSFRFQSSIISSRIKFIEFISRRQTRNYYKIMDTNRHFGKGSTQPEFPDNDHLRLYSMRFCPFAHRVHLVLNAKNIPYHVAYINLTEKPEWYPKVNPNGKVPALQLMTEPNHPFLVESMIIAEYLDEKFPENKLYPSDPLEKAETKLWIERFGAIPGPFYRLVYEENTAENVDKLLTTLYTELASFESELTKRGLSFFAGSKPGILDYAIWPWFERFNVLATFVGEKYNFDARFPRLVKWIHSMKEDPAVQKHMLSTFIHTKFSTLRRANTPNYDILDELAEED